MDLSRHIMLLYYTVTMVYFNCFELSSWCQCCHSKITKLLPLLFQNRFLPFILNLCYTSITSIIQYVWRNKIVFFRKNFCKTRVTKIYFDNQIQCDFNDKVSSHKFTAYELPLCLHCEDESFRKLSSNSYYGTYKHKPFINEISTGFT